MTTTYSPAGPVAIARRPEPAPIPTMTEIQALMAYATTISDAGAALPDAYRKQPGAILLAREWADAHGVDLLTTIQTVNFVKGRPIVDAAMQRALAQRSGYRLHIDADQAGQATVTVANSTGELGTVTYTMADADQAGLAGKDNWRKHPREMLVAAATRLALRWHAPDVLVGVWTEDDLDDTPEAPAVAPLAAAPATAAPATAAEDDSAPATPVVETVDAEIVDEPTPSDWTEEELRAELRRRKVSMSTFVPAAQRLSPAERKPATLVDVITQGLVDATLAEVAP